MKFETPKQFSEDLAYAYQNKKPFCAVSIGDGEALFLLDIGYCQPDARNGIYHNRSELEKGVRLETMQMLPSADYILAVDDPAERIAECRRFDQPVWMQHIHSYPIVMEKAKAMDVKLLDLHEKYKMPIEGGFFDAMGYANILLIGSFAETVYNLYKIPEFRDFYRIKGQAVGFINTPRTNSIESLYEVEEQVHKMYAFQDYDIALVAMGIPANHLCLKIKKWGGIALDIGQTMSALGGDISQRRSFFEKYLNVDKWISNLKT